MLREATPERLSAFSGGEPYKEELKNLEFHLLDTGHCALEENGDLIADLMRNFLRKNVKR
jgi:organic radical activating enzyme